MEERAPNVLATCALQSERTDGAYPNQQNGDAMLLECSLESLQNDKTSLPCKSHPGKEM